MRNHMPKGMTMRAVTLYCYFVHRIDPTRRLRREIVLTGCRREVAATSLAMVNGTCPLTIQWVPTYGSTEDWLAERCILSVIEEGGGVEGPLTTTVTANYEYRIPLHEVLEATTKRLTAVRSAG